MIITQHGLSYMVENPAKEVIKRSNLRPGKMQIIDNNDGSYTAKYDSYWSTFTYIPFDWGKPLDYSDYNILPALKYCVIRVCSEFAENWGGFEGIVPDNKNVYCVNISLAASLDNSGKPVFGDYDELFISSGMVYEYFGIDKNPVSKFYNLLDKEGYLWNSRKDDAIKIAKYLKSELEKRCYSVEISL